MRLSELKRAWGKASADHIDILAAGVAYYTFLAMVPLLAAGILSYSLIADPETVAAHIADLADILPPAAQEIVGGQLESLSASSGGKKGLGLLLAMAIALFGARNGAKAVISAIAIAFNQTETRGFLKQNALALIVTVGAVLGIGLAAIALTATAFLQDLLPALPGSALVLGKLAPYLAVFALGSAGAAILYRRAPPGIQPDWRVVLPGAILSAAGWVLTTVGFSLYVSNFANYNATYGSLGAVVVLLTWLWLAAYMLLFGAELAAVRVQHRIPGG